MSVKLSSSSMIPLERIANAIYLIRGEEVMLDKDLAELYGVKTGRLNEQVPQNKKRFPEVFMFQVTTHETDALRLKFAILKTGGRGSASQISRLRFH